MAACQVQRLILNFRTLRQPAHTNLQTYASKQLYFPRHPCEQLQLCPMQSDAAVPKSPSCQKPRLSRTNEKCSEGRV